MALVGPEVPATEAASASVNAADAADDDAADDASFSAAHVPPKDASSLDADDILYDKQSAPQANHVIITRSLWPCDGRGR